MMASNQIRAMKAAERSRKLRADNWRAAEKIRKLRARKMRMSSTNKGGGEKPVRDLAELVQDLPVELYDEILEYTLAFDEGIVEINKDYKPPVQLQICKAVRNDLGRKYFWSTTFTTKPELFDVFAKWCKSITPQWRYWLAKVRLDNLHLHDGDKTIYDPCSPRKEALILAHRAISAYFEQLGHRGACLNDDQVCGLVSWEEDGIAKEELAVFGAGFWSTK